jgi:hypothetical protein
MKQIERQQIWEMRDLLLALKSSTIKSHIKYKAVRRLNKDPTGHKLSLMAELKHMRLYIKRDLPKNIRYFSFFFFIEINITYHMSRTETKNQGHGQAQ